MTAPTPSVKSPAWILWLSNFPNVPENSLFALRWATPRLKTSLDPLPNQRLLSSSEKRAIRIWLIDYAQQFESHIRARAPVIDVVDIAGTVGALTGLASATVAPQAIVLKAAVSSALIARKAKQAVDQNTRHSQMATILSLPKQTTVRLS